MIQEGAKEYTTSELSKMLNKYWFSVELYLCRAEFNGTRIKRKHYMLTDEQVKRLDELISSRQPNRYTGKRKNT